MLSPQRHISLQTTTIALVPRCQHQSCLWLALRICFAEQAAGDFNQDTIGPIWRGRHVWPSRKSDVLLKGLLTPCQSKPNLLVRGCLPPKVTNPHEGQGQFPVYYYGVNMPSLSPIPRPAARISFLWEGMFLSYQTKWAPLTPVGEEWGRELCGGATKLRAPLLFFPLSRASV